MARITWDGAGERRYETGVDHGVLYLPNAQGAYDKGYAWNGLTTVTESPSGAESNPQYADNIKYLNLLSAEEFGATVEAFTYPDEFMVCDGTAVVNGISIGQQGRRMFGLSYRSILGNDLLGNDYGYKLHLIYGAQAAPSEKAYGTVNDSPEAINFSWELTTAPVGVGEIGGVAYKPTAILTIPSNSVPQANLKALEDRLYGTAGTNPYLPLPAEVIAMFDGVLAEVVPQVPAFAAATGVITIPNVTGVRYLIDGAVVTGVQPAIPAGSRKVVAAQPDKGFKFPNDIVTAWQFNRA